MHIHARGIILETRFKRASCKDSLLKFPVGSAQSWRHCCADMPGPGGHVSCGVEFQFKALQLLSQLSVKANSNPKRLGFSANSASSASRALWSNTCRVQFQSNTFRLYSHLYVMCLRLRVRRSFSSLPGSFCIALSIFHARQEITSQSAAQLPSLETWFKRALCKDSVPKLPVGSLQLRPVPLWAQGALEPNGPTGAPRARTLWFARE